jgi:hypothetical protein
MDETGSDMLWNGSEEDEEDESTDCEDEDSDTDCYKYIESDMLCVLSV